MAGSANVVKNAVAAAIRKGSLLRSSRMELRTTRMNALADGIMQNRLSRYFFMSLFKLPSSTALINWITPGK